MDKQEAIKILKEVHDTSALFSVRTALETFIPELKESEDEKIRKRIIHALHGDVLDMEETNKAIAWLEKQGGITKLSEEEQNRFAKGVLSSCALSFIDYLDAHKYEGKMCVSNGECEDIENAFHNAMWDRLHRYYCKYIEKQGERKSSDEVLKIRQEVYQSGYNDGYKHGIEDAKPVEKPINQLDIEIPFGAKDSELIEESYYIPKGYHAEISKDKVTIKKGEQKPSWSEDDEKNLQGIIDEIQANKSSAPSYDINVYDRYLSWLKSIRQRIGG